MRVLVALLLALVAFSAHAQTLPQTQGPTPGQTPRSITVTGEGQVAVEPDLMRIEVGVETLAPSAAEALADNAARMTALFAVLDAEGIAPADMQTSQLSLYPQYSSDDRGEVAPRITGYTASVMVQVLLRDLTRGGAVLDALTAEGANRLSGISFDISAPEPLRDEARRAAVADALRKAGLYAEAAGVTLGAVQTLTEEFASPRPEGAMMARMDASAMPIAGGETVISARVRVVIAID